MMMLIWKRDPADSGGEDEDEETPGARAPHSLSHGLKPAMGAASRSSRNIAVVMVVVGVVVR